jgi:hypothetical protein
MQETFNRKLVARQPFILRTKEPQPFFARPDKEFAPGHCLIADAISCPLAPEYRS